MFPLPSSFVAIKPQYSSPLPEQVPMPPQEWLDTLGTGQNPKQKSEDQYKHKTKNEKEAGSEESKELYLVFVPLVLQNPLLLVQGAKDHAIKVHLPSPLGELVLPVPFGESLAHYQSPLPEQVPMPPQEWLDKLGTGQSAAMNNQDQEMKKSKKRGGNNKKKQSERASYLPELLRLFAHATKAANEKKKKGGTSKAEKVMHPPFARTLSSVELEILDEEKNTK
ncbi:unnamed protein product [Caenorhabditis sp. 36 PRJEB53466]|nr:unnamed protein product [Caenorhabditis sp. 36 PRJEB53466]